jgi:XTP/dITP diphosphohydrolase
MEKLTIILSTGNPSKAAQIKPFFEGLPISVLTLQEAGIEGAGDENGDTLLHNSTQKAMYAWDNLTEKTWTMADDSGLFLEALDGKPGVQAATWAGKDATTSEITQYTLEQMRGKENRNAVWKTCAVVISPDGEKYVFYGECPGKLLTEQRRPPQPKMPYSGIFHPGSDPRVWSEMSIEEENAISHRGQAFRQVRKFFENILSQ